MLKNQHRFFISSENLQGNKVLITNEELVHQIAGVLRLKIGDQIILLDNSGLEYSVNLEKISPQIEGYVLEKRKNENEPNKKIILCQSLLKSDKFEQVLKFCTNLGISGFIPFVSKNSIIKEISPHKLDRYQKIIQESAEQSGRGVLPRLEKLMAFSEILSFISNSQHWHKICLPAQAGKLASCSSEAKVLKLIGWEQEKEKNLTNFSGQIKKAEEIYLLIGPEGGFTQEEISLAKKAGCLTFSLGKLILRSEIAGLVASAFIFQDKGI